MSLLCEEGERALPIEVITLYNLLLITYLLKATTSYSGWQILFPGK